MHGNNDRRTVLGALVLSVVVTTGVAAAAPVDVLRATDGIRECVAPLSEGAIFHYRYIESMYERPVIEDLTRRNGRIAVLRIHSGELRAIEYFGWQTPITQDGDGHVQEAPRYETDRLLVRVSPPYAQRIDGDGWTCDLEARFGDDLVTVTLAVRPAASVLR